MQTSNKYLAFLLALTLSGCSTTNSLNPPTGSTAGAVGGGIIGAAVGTGAALALPVPKLPVIALATVGGAGLGYYLTTLRFSARGIYAAGGQVYTLGDYVVINIPTDNLFDANTADFLANTDPVLQSVYAVLNRYPNHNVIISGNTSGSWSTKFELAMSLCRAEQMASYLWAHGIGVETRRYGRTPDHTYVGYGDKFPISNIIHIKGIRQNSRIQIIAYPSQQELNWNVQCKTHFKRYPGYVENLDEVAQKMEWDRYQLAYNLDEMPEPTTDSYVKFNGEVEGVIPETQT